MIIYTKNGSMHKLTLVAVEHRFLASDRKETVTSLYSDSGIYSKVAPTEHPFSPLGWTKEETVG